MNSYNSSVREKYKELANYPKLNIVGFLNIGKDSPEVKIGLKDIVDSFLKTLFPEFTKALAPTFHTSMLNTTELSIIKLA